MGHTEAVFRSKPVSSAAAYQTSHAFRPRIRWTHGANRKKMALIQLPLQRHTPSPPPLELMET